MKKKRKKQTKQDLKKYIDFKKLFANMIVFAMFMITAISIFMYSNALSNTNSSIKQEAKKQKDELTKLINKMDNIIKQEDKLYYGEDYEDSEIKDYELSLKEHLKKQKLPPVTKAPLPKPEVTTTFKGKKTKISYYY